MPKTQSLTKKKSIMDMLSGKQILIPIAALLLLAVFNLIADPSFYKITLDVNSSGNHVLSGYLITILDYGSELAILAIGMTLVTAASGGQDISVGAGIAIAGSVTRAVRKQFTSGSVTGTDYRGISGKLCRCDAFWSIQRNIGGGI